MVANNKHLRTVGEVLDVIGIERARKIARVTARDAHFMWKNRGAFPPRTFAAMNAVLEANGYTAAAALWRQRELTS